MTVEDVSSSERPLARPGPFVALAVVTLAALVGLAISIVRDPGLPAHVSAYYMRVAGGLVTPTVFATDAATLSAALAARPASALRVPELAASGWRLDGGTGGTLGGRPAATAIYRNDIGEYLVWQAMDGTADELPPTADVRDLDGRRFFVHYKATNTLVFWQEGPRLVVLVASLPGEHVVAVARVAAAAAPR
jgi:anti-sigma factor RsiW